MLAIVVLAGCNQGSNTGSTGAAASGSSAPSSASASTGSATLSWEAPTTDTNGAPLTNLSGYRIYYGPSAGNLSQTIQLAGVGMQTYVIDNLGAGTWFFAIQAVTSTGMESALSDVVSKTIG